MAEAKETTLQKFHRIMDFLIDEVEIYPGMDFEGIEMADINDMRKEVAEKLRAQ